MNERIKELVRESNLDMYGLGKERHRWEYTVEKFAELIVRECADLCDRYQEIPATEPRHCANDIRSMFGVEEK